MAADECSYTEIEHRRAARATITVRTQTTVAPTHSGEATLLRDLPVSCATERKPLVSYGFFVAGAAGAVVGFVESMVGIGLAESVMGFGATESGFTVESTGVAGIDWVALAGLVLSITG
jgi:hypothetical protein